MIGVSVTVSEEAIFLNFSTTSMWELDNFFSFT